MKKLVAAFLLITLGLFAPVSYGQKAVDFTFTTTRNKVIHLSDFKGKWVLVNFWASWCPRCFVEFPTLRDLDSRKDFVVIGIAMDYAGETTTILNTITRHNLDYLQVLGGDRHSSNPNTPMNQVGPVDFYPVSYLYDPSGELIMYIPGAISREKILEFIGSYKK